MPPEPVAATRSDPPAHPLVTAGRIVLASLFVLGGVAKVASPDLYLSMMNGAGLPFPGPLLALVAALEFGGGLWIASNRRGYGHVALVLAAHTMLINLLLHPFWTLAGAERIAEISFFFKNVSIVGGLLLVAGLERSGSRVVVATTATVRNTTVTRRP